MGSPFTSSLNSISFHFHTHPSFLRPVDAPKFGSVFLMPSPQEKLGHFKESSISFSTRNFRIRSRSGKTRFSSPRNSNSSPHASNGDSDPPAKAKLLVVSSIIIVSLAVANRVLYKLALVPLKQYPFFLAQLTTFGQVIHALPCYLFNFFSTFSMRDASTSLSKFSLWNVYLCIVLKNVWNFCPIIRGSSYVIVYFSILYLRHRANIVTDEMISLPKSRLLAVGLLEALGIATGMTAAGITIIQYFRFFLWAEISILCG